MAASKEDELRRQERTRKALERRGELRQKVKEFADWVRSLPYSERDWALFELRDVICLSCGSDTTNRRCYCECDD